MRLAFRLRLQSCIQNRFDPLWSIGRFAAAPGRDLPQTLQPLFREALTPQPYCLAIDLQRRLQSLTSDSPRPAANTMRHRKATCCGVPIAASHCSI